MTSIGFTAVLAGISLFCLLYAIYAPIKTIKFIQQEKTNPVDIENMSSSARAFDKYIRPMLRNFFPQSPVDVTLSNMQKDRITELIIRSGNPWGLRAEEFRATQILLAVLGLFAGIILAAVSAIPAIPPIIFILLLPVMGWAFPFSTYNTAREKRIKKVNRELPEALDLIRVSMASGSRFPLALANVIPKLEPGTLQEEFARVSQEMNAGLTISKALNNLSRRSPSDQVESFCKAVIQGEELGVTIDDTLRSQSDLARRNYEAELDKKIARLPSRMFLFIIPTILPALILIFTAPSIMQLFNSL